MNKIGWTCLYLCYFFVILSDSSQRGDSQLLASIYQSFSLLLVFTGNIIFLKFSKIKKIFLFPIIFFFFVLLISIFRQNYLFNNLGMIIYSFFSYSCLLFSFISFSINSIKQSFLDIFSSRLFFFSLLFIIIVLIIGLLNFDFEQLQRCNEHSLRSYGTQNVNLFCSYFDSSKKFARYLQFPYLLIICSLIELDQKNCNYEKLISNSTKRYILISSIIYLTLCSISGAREAIIISLILITTLIFYINYNINIFKLKILKLRFKKELFLPIIIPILSFVSLLIFALIKNFLFLEYIFFIGDNSLLVRLNSLIPLEIFENLNIKNFVGNGLGIYGQEARIYSEKLSLEAAANTLNIDYYSLLKITDSGAAKLIMEIGSLGIIFLLFIIIISIVSSNKLKSGVLRKVFLSILIFSLLKLHLVMSDPIYLSLYSISSVSLCCILDKYHRTHIT